MNLDDIHNVDVPEDVSTVSSRQLKEWEDLADEVQGIFSDKPNYYKAIVEKAKSDKRVNQAKRALELKREARLLHGQISDEIMNREVEIDDRDHIRASYADDSGKLTYIDPDEREMKLRIDVEDIEYRISESLGREVMSDEMHGKDVHVETEVLTPDRFIIVASEDTRKAQIEVTGNVVTHVEK